MKYLEDILLLIESKDNVSETILYSSNSITNNSTQSSLKEFPNDNNTILNQQTLKSIDSKIDYKPNLSNILQKNEGNNFQGNFFLNFYNFLLNF